MSEEQESGSVSILGFFLFKETREIRQYDKVDFHYSGTQEELSGKLTFLGSGRTKSRNPEMLL